MKLECMNGGEGATSYTNNSGLQRFVISKTWGVLEETLNDMFANGYFRKHTIRVADLGCSCGPNTLLVVSHIIKHLCKLGLPPHKIEIFLNDLPGNDFNNLFKLVYDENNSMGREILDACSCIYAAPGSFYGKLFPTNTLHFAYSSYSIHWLSQIPEGVGKNNMENIHLSMTSPPQVFEAYANQFQTDFSGFLRFRGEEIVANGCMVLAFIARRFVDPSPNDGLINLYTMLAQILLKMVAQGIVKEEDLYSFNVPVYLPSMQEVEAIIRGEGSFHSDKTEVFEVPWDANEDGVVFDKHRSGKFMAATVRACMEPMLLSHFGPSLDLDAVFDFYAHKMEAHLATHKLSYFSPVISLSRKPSQT